jgi:acylphosphatase
MQEKIARRYLVSGTVQGVGYRFFASRLAERLGLAGFVKNLGDGRVEVYAIGPGEALRAFHLALKSGPTGADVEGVHEEEAAVNPRFANRFTIERESW